MNQQLRPTSTSNLKTCNWLNSWKIISLMINRRDVIDYFIKVVTEPIEKRRAKEKKRRERRLKRLLRLFPSICHVIVVLLKRKKRWRRRKRRTRRRRRARAKKKTAGKLDKSTDWIGIGLSREFSDSFCVVPNSKERSKSISCYDGFESYHLIELPCLCRPTVQIHNKPNNGPASFHLFPSFFNR